MNDRFIAHLRHQIQELKDGGLYKEERVIDSQQSADIHVAGGDAVINFCANNYLGLANHPRLIRAAQEGLDKYGYGMASVRFICGTQTVHKALGGASGGYTAGRREVIDWLRNRSRPYLFSNTLMPAIAAASLTVLDLIEDGDELRARLRRNAQSFREQMSKLGFTLAGADHPIIPVMLGDAVLAKEMSTRLLKEGIYVVGFSFPVVPRGQARIRTQMSAAHQPHHIDKAVAAFAKVGRELGVIR